MRSYIQTGNIFFETEHSNKSVLREKIETHLSQHLGFDVTTCLRTLEELEQIISLRPFKSINHTPNTRFAISFLAEKTQERLPFPCKTADGGYELIGMTDSELFIVWHLINGRPRSSYKFKKSFESTSTTRFWHTTKKILIAAKKK